MSDKSPEDGRARYLALRLTVTDENQIIGRVVTSANPDMSPPPSRWARFLAWWRRRSR